VARKYTPTTFKVHIEGSAPPLFVRGLVDAICVAAESEAKALCVRDIKVAAFVSENSATERQRAVEGQDVAVA
jgi:hypothetical protein